MGSPSVDWVMVDAIYNLFYHFQTIRTICIYKSDLVRYLDAKK